MVFQMLRPQCDSFHLARVLGILYSIFNVNSRTFPFGCEAPIFCLKAIPLHICKLGNSNQFGKKIGQKTFGLFPTELIQIRMFPPSSNQVW